MADASNSPQKKIVILGTSYGGVSTAHYLLKHAIPKLPNKDDYQILLISPSTEVLCRPATPRAFISDDLLPQNKLFVNVSKLFEQYAQTNFRYVHGKAIALDHKARTVSIKLVEGRDEHIEYYTLVIATGSTTTSPLHGLNADEKVLREDWAKIRKALPDAKNIVIAGGGPTGVETAGELGEYFNGRAGWFQSKIENPKKSITLVTSGPNLLPVLRTTLATAAEGYLAKVGVTVIKNARVKAVSPPGAGTDDIASKASLTLDDGRVLEADLYIPAAGAHANTGFISKDLLTADGRVDTNESTLRVDRAGPRVYAIGDVGSYSRPAIHLMMEAIPIVSANIKKDLLEDSGADKASLKEDRIYEVDTRETQLVPIGTSAGVGAAMGYWMPSFLVWLIKGRDYWLWTTGDLWSGKQWNKEK